MMFVNSTQVFSFLGLSTVGKAVKANLTQRRGRHEYFDQRVPGLVIKAKLKVKGCKPCAAIWRDQAEMVSGVRKLKAGM